MAYEHTNLSIESNLDILDKYKQFIEATSDGDMGSAGLPEFSKYLLLK